MISFSHRRGNPQNPDSTALVREELGPWLNAPFCNRALRETVQEAADHGHSHIHFDDVDNSMKQHGYEYYLNLLGLRKYEGAAFAMVFEKQNGRPPNQEEFAAEIKKRYGDRGYMIAVKGWRERGRANYLADEQLVVMAVLSAILSGNEVIIITRDHDVQEQFYKMLFLVDTHYRSMLLADRYVASPSSFPSMPIPEQSARDRFVGEDNVVFDPLFNPELGDRHDLPASYRFVNIECWWVGGGANDLRLCRMIFSSEREMARVLATKARTRGLNTDKLGGRNCHLWPFPERNFGMAAVVTDRRVTDGQHEYLALDTIHTLCSHERQGTVEHPSPYLDPDPYRRTSGL